VGRKKNAREGKSEKWLGGGGATFQISSQSPTAFRLCASFNFTEPKVGTYFYFKQNTTLIPPPPPSATHLPHDNEKSDELFHYKDAIVALEGIKYFRFFLT